MRRHTVTLEQVATTDDGLGNTTEMTTETTVERVAFEPPQFVERTDSRAPAVVGSAKFYGPFPLVSADDVIRHDTTCCDEPQIAGRWQVRGGGSRWGAKSEVPVTRASAV